MHDKRFQKKKGVSSGGPLVGSESNDGSSKVEGSPGGGVKPDATFSSNDQNAVEVSGC